MCGIAGVFHFDPNRGVDPGVLTAMRRVTEHRGPDDSGLYANGSVGLTFNRLSIIDVAGGHQPMANGDGTAWIVFNGEIYNFDELRRELLAAGYPFQTRSDTEVILAAWEHYGEECVSRLRGMFAFAIWDSRRRVLFAARDRIGIKPFYYYSDAETFAFASELKALLVLPRISRSLDEVSLADYLRHGYAMTPHTLLRDIRKLEPAHSLTVQRSGVSTDRYWELPLVPPEPINESRALEEFGELLDESVRMHLISDVPLGVFLSGGLDSSAIVSVMSRLRGRNLKTFGVGYAAKESELDNSRLVSRHCGTDHHEVVLTPREFRDRLPKVVWHMDEPVADAPSIPLYSLAEEARKHVTVVLSGEGADEVLGGYPAYRRMLAIDQINRVPFAGIVGKLFRDLAPEGKIRKNGSMLGLPLEARYRAAVIFSRREIERLRAASGIVEDHIQELARAYDRCKGLDSLARMSYVDMQGWLPDDLLTKADRMTMAHGLELRVPFLDHKLVEFGARLPRALKVRGWQTKYILKELMGPRLPSSIIHQKKRGFPIPLRHWFRHELAGYVRETLLATDSPNMTLFDRREIERTIEAHRTRDCSLQIYSLLVFDSWCRTFARGSDGPNVPSVETTITLRSSGETSTTRDPESRGSSGRLGP